MAETAVALADVTKRFGLVEVLSPINLEIEEGSFTSLLGPSGCGKTTILNIIAGLEEPSEGSVSIGGRTVFDRRKGLSLPTERRNIGYVFQTYALWPHMTVSENVAYPLKLRRVGRAERRAEADAILDRLELGHLGDRYPFQLSGGQQQRVAIARSLVYRAKLLLLDEPLSNLDAQLRERARAWLTDVHREFSLTTILVTHDQSEAMSLSDRVILLSKGRVEQDGSPEAIYETPNSTYAAEFVGNANLIPGEIVASTTTPGGFAITLKLKNGTELTVPARVDMPPGSQVGVSIRPQKLALADPAAALPPGSIALPFELRNTLYQGATVEMLGDTPVGLLRIVSGSRPTQSFGHVILRAEDCLCVLQSDAN